MNLSQLLSFLQDIGASAQKRLSQNFLIDGNIVRKICDVAHVQPNDRVLEIGPGPGALTEELLKRGAEVFAIEKDRKFAAALPRLQGNLEVVEADVLDFSFDRLTVPPYKVIANLPYHITTPILEKLFEFSHLFSEATLMVQKEVAERLQAIAGTKQMSSFTIFLQTYCIPSVAMHVTRNCFYPAPEVDSSVIRLVFKTPAVEDPKPFLAMVRNAFQQRRKMLRSTLGVHAAPFATMRPEDLSFDAWLELYTQIN